MSSEQPRIRQRVRAYYGPTIIIDPPWEYSAASNHKKLRGYAIGEEREYDSLSTEDLRNLPIANRANYLFLWTTAAFTEAAYSLVRSWEFEPITSIYWVKTSKKLKILSSSEDDIDEKNICLVPSYGVGYWFRGCVEPIIVAKKKKAPSIRTNYVGLLSPVLNHSRKPNSLHELIEDRFPGPYYELFGRRARNGWTILGNEAPGDGEDIRNSIHRIPELRNT